MLSPACEAFRGSATLRPDAPHARACPRCRRFAEELLHLELLRSNLALPPTLRASLLSIPAGVASGELFEGLDPLPGVPLPDDLRTRLRRLPRAAQRPPAWIRSARYAVAACYVATVLTGAAFGNPARAGQDVVAAVAREATEIAQKAGERGRPIVEELERSARRTYAAGRTRLHESADWIKGRYWATMSSLWPADSPITTDDSVDDEVDD